MLMPYGPASEDSDLPVLPLHTLGARIQSRPLSLTQWAYSGEFLGAALWIP